MSQIWVTPILESVEQGDKEVLPLIEQFFRGIEADPNCGIVFFQVAINLIEKNKHLEQKEDFESRIKWLAKITEKADSDELKSRLLKVIEDL